MQCPTADQRRVMKLLPEQYRWRIVWRAGNQILHGNEMHHADVIRHIDQEFGLSCDWELVNPRGFYVMKAHSRLGQRKTRVWIKWFDKIVVDRRLQVVVRGSSRPGGGEILPTLRCLAPLV